MSLPDALRLQAALEATWPPAASEIREGWLLREGASGGKRVSAASPLTPHADPAHAQAAMRARGQTPLFRLGIGDAAIDAQLAGLGYRLLDPTLIYAASTATLARKPGPVSLFALWPPLAIMRDIWAEGGIDAPRLAVMARVKSPKTALIARIDDRAAGAAFCALDGDIAMLHAIEVLPEHRRKRVGALIVHGAADWALAAGAQCLALAVTEANHGARALYERAGMKIVTRYHYREEVKND